MNISRGRALPPPAIPAGYAWLIDRYQLELPLPPQLVAVAGGHRPREAEGWLILPERYRPAESLGAQLTFALKREGVDLAVLDSLFATVPSEQVAEAVRAAPTSGYMRRTWFLHEWLTGRQLDLSDAGKVKAVEVVDPERQVALPRGEISRRHRVRNNLPGTPGFCPMVRRTRAIRAAQTARLGEQARRVIGRTPADVLARAATFLLLADSRASHRIEGETPSPERALRWAQTIARAGTTQLSADELISLQRRVIGDSRFVNIGLRTEGGFVGEHDRLTGAPIPDHISARATDLESLIGGMVAYDQRAIAGKLDPVVAAAVAAFGFAYVHPFEDGNGRIHRWMIHHTLAAAGFTPGDMIFPVSAVMLREIGTYRAVLESYSQWLLPLIRWQATERGNVDVLNDTARFYRFFDATRHAEFLYECVETTVRRDLPYEVRYLEAYDRFAEGIAAIVDMPARTIDQLHRFLRQNEGRLSQRARSREFAALTDREVARIEALYADFASSLPSEVGEEGVDGPNPGSPP